MLFKSTDLLAFVVLSVLTTTLGQFTTSCNSPGGTISSGAGNCSAFTNQMCDSVAQSSLVAHKLAAKDTTVRCFTLADGLGRKCQFTVANTKTADTGTIPNNANCKSAFTAVTNACDFGGRSVIVSDDFTVKLDFNFGTCFS
ncbi:hypothetical protein C8J57DRAFT_1282240 [Mycena rebaudengoi]|nr:hypothetical protein C8J57DRAFT_1282240 [Mycena rebaudengoi]